MINKTKKSVKAYERQSKMIGECLVYPYAKSVARRLYIARHGEIPSDIFVCHTCDNPRCILDTHHFPGTLADNMKDCAEKGRMKAAMSKPEVRKKISDGLKRYFASSYGQANASAQQLKRYSKISALIRHAEIMRKNWANASPKNRKARIEKAKCCRAVRQEERK